MIYCNKQGETSIEKNNNQYWSKNQRTLKDHDTVAKQKTEKTTMKRKKGRKVTGDHTQREQRAPDRPEGQRYKWAQGGRTGRRTRGNCKED